MISNWAQSCTWVTGGSSRPLPCPQKVGSAYHSHSPSHIQGHSLDRAIRCSDVLDLTCRWPQLAPLYRPLRLRLWGAEINSCCSPPRQAAYVRSLTYYTAATYHQTGVVSSSTSSSNLSSLSANFHFTWEAFSRVQTKGKKILGKTVNLNSEKCLSFVASSKAGTRLEASDMPGERNLKGYSLSVSRKCSAGAAERGPL